MSSSYFKGASSDAFFFFGGSPHTMSGDQLNLWCWVLGIVGSLWLLYMISTALYDGYYQDQRNRAFETFLDPLKGEEEPTFSKKLDVFKTCGLHRYEGYFIGHKTDASNWNNRNRRTMDLSFAWSSLKELHMVSGTGTDDVSDFDLEKGQASKETAKFHFMKTYPEHKVQGSSVNVYYMGHFMSNSDIVGTWVMSDGEYEGTFEMTYVTRQSLSRSRSKSRARARSRSRP